MNTIKQYEEFIEEIETSVNEIWDDAEFLRGGDVCGVAPDFYTTIQYFHNHKSFMIHTDVKYIDVYEDSMKKGLCRLAKIAISENWKSEFKEFIKTI